MVVGECRTGRSRHPSSDRTLVVEEVGRRRPYQVAAAASWGCLGGRDLGTASAEGQTEGHHTLHPGYCRSQQGEALAGAAGQAWLAGTEVVVG